MSNISRQIRLTQYQESPLSATRLDETLQPLNTTLFVESNPIPVKWAVSQMGLIESHVRLPLTDHDPQYHGAMRAALATAGVVLENAA